MQIQHFKEVSQTDYVPGFPLAAAWILRSTSIMICVELSTFLSTKSVEDCISVEKLNTLNTDLHHSAKHQSIFSRPYKGYSHQYQKQSFTWILPWILWDFLEHLFCITYDNQIQIGVLKNLAKFSRKLLCWSLLLIKPLVSNLQVFKRHSSTGVFLLLLGNFWKQLFYRTLLDDCLSNTIQISLH